MENPDIQQVTEIAKSVGDKLSLAIDNIRSALSELESDSHFNRSAHELYNLQCGIVSFRALLLFTFDPEFYK